MERKLKWKTEKAFKGFGCSDCGWIFPNPTMAVMDREADVDAEVMKQVKEKFAAHKCSEHPQRKRT